MIAFDTSILSYQFLHIGGEIGEQLAQPRKMVRLLVIAVVAMCLLRVGSMHNAASACRRRNPPTHKKSPA
jgi:hypothetical protein